MTWDWTSMGTEFRYPTEDEMRLDMRAEHDAAVAAGVDPMVLYRGHLLRARLLKEIIDKEAAE